MGRETEIHFFFLFFSTLFLHASGYKVPEFRLKDRVFVALRGEDLIIGYETLPNQTDILHCFDPWNKCIYTNPVSAGQFLTIVIKNMTISGEYYCQYKTAKTYWFLQVSDGYKEMMMSDYTELIVVAVFTGVLLVISVAGSVYIFRGHWTRGKAGDEIQDRDEVKEDKKKKANVEPSQSTSDYASLEPRPRSIYDVLDNSAANREKDQPKATSKKKETHKAVPQNQEEGIFECVYENFE